MTAITSTAIDLNFDYWAKLGTTRLKISVRLSNFDDWATEFCLQISGFLFHQKWNFFERLDFVKSEIRRTAQIKPYVRDLPNDCFTVGINIKIGDQEQTKEKQFLKSMRNRANWGEILNATWYFLIEDMITWEFEEIK